MADEGGLKSRSWVTHADAKEALEARFALASVLLVVPLSVISALRDALVAGRLEAFVALALVVGPVRVGRALGLCVRV